MRLEKEVLGGATVLRPSGSIQSGNNAAFAAALAALRAAGTLRVIVDAAGLDYINSRAIGDLVLFHHELRLSGGDLALAGLRPGVEKVVRAVGLQSLVAIHPDAAGALAAWGVRAEPPAAGPGRSGRPARPLGRSSRRRSRG